MKKLMACVALAAMLAACGQTATVESEAPPPAPPAVTPPAPEFPVAPTDASAGPSGTDNKTWVFYPTRGRTTDGVERPALMYSNGGSDSWFMNIQCDPGTNNAHVLGMRDSETGTSWPFTLQSGAARAQLTATPRDPGPPGGGEIGTSAPVALDAPVMAAFRSTGALTQIEDGRSFVSNAINDDERATIAQFFAACS